MNAINASLLSSLYHIKVAWNSRTPIMARSSAAGSTTATANYGYVCGVARDYTRRESDAVMVVSHRSLVLSLLLLPPIICARILHNRPKEKKFSIHDLYSYPLPPLRCHRSSA